MPDSLVRPRYRTLFKVFYTDLGLYLGWDMEQPADTLGAALTPPGTPAE